MPLKGEHKTPAEYLYRLLSAIKQTLKKPLSGGFHKRLKQLRLELFALGYYQSTQCADE
jgi:hypothetical protein